MTDIQPYDVLGATWRWGTTPDGTPFAVAVDVARSFGHRDSDRVTRLLEDDEKGTQIVGTPGGPQEMTVVYEDGIWELIFRSGRPEALALKKRVKEVLRLLRNGQLAMPERRELSRRDLAQMVIEEADRADAAEARAAELAPAAESWEALASAEGDYPLADAAKILARAGMKTGQNRLFKRLGEMGWLYRARSDGKWRPDQTMVNRGYLVAKPMHYTDPLTGDEVQKAPQVRITIDGIAALRRVLSAGTDLGEAA